MVARKFIKEHVERSSDDSGAWRGPDAQLFVCKARVSIVITIRDGGNIVDLFYLLARCRFIGWTLTPQFKAFRIQESVGRED